MITNSIKQDYKYPTDMKTIMYTNSKQQAMGSITNAMESVIRTSPNQGDVIARTGEDGIQYKVSQCMPLHMITWETMKTTVETEEASILSYQT